MRVVNSILHFLIVLLFFWGLSLHAQIQGDRTQLYEGTTSNRGDDNDCSGSGTTCMVRIPDAVSVGDLIFVGWESGGNSAMSATDDLGNTFTCPGSASSATCSATTYYVGGCYSVSAFAGNDIVHLSYSNGGAAVSATAGRFKNVTGTLDGGVTTGCTAGLNTDTVVSANKTTTINGDTLIGITGFDNGTTSGTVVSPSQYVAMNNIHGMALLSMQYTGIAGAKTISTINGSGSSSVPGVMQLFPFKPTAGTIVVTTTAMPNTDQAHTYDAFLGAMGGTGAYTYSVVSGALPTGLSLTAATGEITGTCGASGAATFGIQATDGTLTSATKNVTITCGATYHGTPSLSQSQSLSLPQNNSTVAYASPLSCGDVEFVILNGADTHFTDGWVQNDSGTLNNITDSNGNILHRVDSLSGTWNAPLVEYVSDPITTSGATSINFNGIQYPGYSGTGFAMGLQGTMGVMQNVQSNFDAGVFGNADPVCFFCTAPNPFTVSASYTTPVDNSFSHFTTVARGDATATITVNSPFTTIQDDLNYTFSDHLFASVTSGTGTATVSSSGNTQRWATGTLIVPFRPRLPMAVCNEVTGVVRHRVQIY